MGDVQGLQALIHQISINSPFSVFDSLVFYTEWYLLCSLMPFLEPHFSQYFASKISKNTENQYPHLEALDVASTHQARINTVVPA